MAPRPAEMTLRVHYNDISGELAHRGVAGFDGELISLEALAGGKPTDPAIAARYNKVIGVVMSATGNHEKRPLLHGRSTSGPSVQAPE